MVRAINNQYLVPLTATFPASRRGALGDVAKVDCATCHQGAYKPLYGVSMLKDYPVLAHPVVASPAPSAAAEVPGASGPSAAADPKPGRVEVAVH
jgi:photosynthetic reaction center cytochrome c subunit